MVVSMKSTWTCVCCSVDYNWMRSSSSRHFIARWSSKNIQNQSRGGKEGAFAPLSSNESPGVPWWSPPWYRFLSKLFRSLCFLGRVHARLEWISNCKNNDCLLGCQNKEGKQENWSRSSHKVLAFSSSSTPTLTQCLLVDSLSFQLLVPPHYSILESSLEINRKQSSSCIICSEFS